MNSAQAQVIALVGFGNATLHGDAASAATDLSLYPLFQHLASITFTRYADGGASEGVVVADSIDAWFRCLKSVQTTRLWNIAFAWHRTDLPEYLAAGYAGGVNVAIQTQSENGYELWFPHWRHTPENREAPWSVEYRSLPYPQSQAISQTDLKAVKAQLQVALENTDRFARRRDIGLARWSVFFKDALRIVERSEIPASARKISLPPFGYTRDAHVLLAASSVADIFAGSDSWSGQSFTDKARQLEFEQNSADLYAAIKYARVMACNSFTAL